MANDAPAEQVDSFCHELEDMGYQINDSVGSDTHILGLIGDTESLAESWVLADRQGFSQAMKVPLNKLPQCPDEESDPKRLILTLVKKSKVRQFSNEVVSSADPSKPGTGYNLHLGAFVRNQWDARGAAQHSPSLARAVMHLERLGAKHV